MSGFVVACIPESPLLSARLRAAVGAQGKVEQFRDGPSALLPVLRGEIDATVVAIGATDAEAGLRTIRHLRAAAATHAIVAWCEIRQPPSRLLLDIAQAEVTELVLRDVEDMQHVLARVLASAVQRSTAQRLDARLSALIAQPMRPLFRFALEHAHESLSVEEVAATFGVTRRTLRNRLVEHRMPRPRVFLTWCRLLVAGALLDERGRSLDSVAGQLDFPSGHGLGMVLRRYLGSGITALRAGQVSGAIEEAFRAALRSLPLEPSAD
jgi:AraC-like DNA-binding protein